MSFPLSQGSNPESDILPADTFVLICTSVSVAKITNLFQAGQTVWLMYTKITNPAPTDLSAVEKWKVPSGYAEFENGSGISNIYAYAVDKDAVIRVEA